ncbi:hypothetical protein MED01_003787 [Micromonospora sp. MED01]|uniref:hypothetical protein n=1 Tax=Micromonospora alfalfae TaxID=2911212 RepID=UPI001EE99427|nr:hypothetical protein [Micromonospora alfalfae]MCG5465503.1 hypothetical protein [Micromonospora alfalfae]
MIWSAVILWCPVSQYLNDVGVNVERGVELVGLKRVGDGAVAALRFTGGQEEQVAAPHAGRRSCH